MVPPVGTEDRVHMLRQGRLSGTVVSQYGYKRTLGHINIHAVDGTVRPDDIAFLVTFVIFIYQISRNVSFPSVYPASVLSDAYRLFGMPDLQSIAFYFTA